MKWVVLILFGAIGAASLVGGVFWGIQRYELTQRGMLTEGVVVDQQEQVSTESSGRATSSRRTVTSYYPIVEFQTEDGESHRFEGTTGGGGAPILETGTHVGVIYDPNVPGDAMIVDFSQAWLGPLTLTVVGAIFLIMGVGSYFLIGRSDRTFAALGETMRRDALVFRQDTIRIQGRIDAVKETERGSGRYVLVAKAVRPGGRFQDEFESDPIPLRPDRDVIGHKVEILLDPADPDTYQVELGPLLKLLRGGR